MQRLELATPQRRKRPNISRIEIHIFYLRQYYANKAIDCRCRCVAKRFYELYRLYVFSQGTERQQRLSFPRKDGHTKRVKSVVLYNSVHHSHSIYYLQSSAIRGDVWLKSPRRSQRQLFRNPEVRVDQRLGALSRPINRLKRTAQPIQLTKSRRMPDFVPTNQILPCRLIIQCEAPIRGAHLRAKLCGNYFSVPFKAGRSIQKLPKEHPFVG